MKNEKIRKWKMGKMKGARGAQEHSPGGWSGKIILAKMKKMKIIKNEWCVPGPAGVARPTEAGRPVFSCVMRWPWRPAASRIRPAGPRPAGGSGFQLIRK